MTHTKRQIALRYWLQGRGYYTALEAMDFAAGYHTGMRKDGVTPEFDHQISICHYVRSLPDLIHEEDTIATMLLHDVMEDYDVKLRTIISLFGDRIAEATELLNKNDESGRPKNHQSMIDAMAKNPIASIGKPADRIHNWNSMGTVFTPKKQLQYVDEGSLLLPMVKEARRRFPRQERAYENIKHMMQSQIMLIRASLQNYKEE